MLLDTVDFPDELIDDLLEGRLVVFAGAGVSLDEPSSLPDFEELLEYVSSSAATEEDKKDLFGAFEKLEDAGISIRALAKHAVSHKKSSAYREASEPNEHHHSVVGLFRDATQIKVVTTNFDSHFSSVLPKGVQRYSVPALPKGDQFNGLVYLHGAIESNLEDLILTERDVARAYIKYGRTTAFLREMFDHYTVLFVGSSHNDPILNLIAKSDLFSGKRYILTEKGREGQWKKLNISPVEYEKGAHDKAWVALGLLKDLTNSSNIQTAEFIREKCQQDPNTLLPHENGWLKYLLLRKTDFTEIFVEHAKDEAWLRWAKDSGLLDQLFSTIWPDDLAVRHRMQRFSFWYCSFIGEHSDICLEVAREKIEDNINVLLARNLTLAIFRLKKLSYFNEWMHIICNAHRHYGFRDSDELTSMLAKCSLLEGKHLALNLLEFLSEPRPSKQNYPLVSFYGDAYWLHEAWENVFLPNLAELHLDLLQILPRNLQKIQNIYEGSRIPGSYLFQDRDERDIGALLVRATRDLFSFLLSESNEVGKIYRTAWLAKDDGDIFRRIAESVAENGKLAEILPTSKAGWVKYKSPIGLEELSAKPPNAHRDILLNWNTSSYEDVEDGFVHTNRQGLMEAVVDAVAQNYAWSLQLLELIELGGGTSNKDLVESLLKGWKKSSLTQNQWPEIIALISARMALFTCSPREVTELVSVGVSSKENSIPEALYQECLELLKACGSVASRDSAILDSKNWYSLAINDQQGKACEAIIDIISKARIGWSKKTLREMLDAFLLPFTTTTNPALAILGRYSFFLFLWDKKWFQKNVLPIIKSPATDQTKFEAVWHGIAYSHEANDGYLPVLVDLLQGLYENAANGLLKTTEDKTLDGDIPEGIAQLTCLTVIRSIVWKGATPITEDWVRHFVTNSTPDIISDVFRNFSRILQGEKFVAAKVDAVWEKAIKPIISNLVVSNKHLSFQNAQSIIEIVPHLSSMFEQAVTLVTQSITFTIDKDYIHPRVYDAIKETKIYSLYPESCFLFVEYLLAQKYAEYSWSFDEVIECLNLLIEQGIAPQRIINLVNEHVFPKAPESARKYCASLQPKSAGQG